MCSSSVCGRSLAGRKRLSEKRLKRFRAGADRSYGSCRKGAIKRCDGRNGAKERKCETAERCCMSFCQQATLPRRPPQSRSRALGFGAAESSEASSASSRGQLADAVASVQRSSSWPSSPAAPVRGEAARHQHRSRPARSDVRLSSCHAERHFPGSFSVHGPIQAAARHSGSSGRSI